VLNAIVAPRAIAWVSSVGADGTLNLAPHSYTTVFSTNPPIVGFVSTGEKDTLRNVRHSGEFTYNVVSDELLDSMNLTSADFPPEISEFSWAELTPLPGTEVSAPRVGESPVAMECRVIQVTRVPGARSWLVLGEVVAVHIDERVWVNERIDLEAVRPLARLGGSDYARFGEITNLKRPVYADLVAGPTGSE
jgi:flavin reductase (DIM6/NTAB) family NADH-FMN oxidoreductase RutF